MNKIRFAAVEFPHDPKVKGNKYWYICPFEGVKEGDKVCAPLGRRGGEQSGVVREVVYTDETHAPYPPKKRSLNTTVTLMEIYAPLVAKKAEAGQFVILRVNGEGERIPLTIAGYDRSAGTVRIIYQIVGATTMLLDEKRAGECLSDFVGPLGCATRTDGVKKVCIVGGGVGCAIALPVAKKFHELGCEVHSILVILEDEFAACSDSLKIMTDDGSYGEKGLVTQPLKAAIERGENYDEVIAIGPLVMMKFVVATTKPYGVKTTVSMNPVMIDGTGMCGGCRLTIGGKTRFACVDGPDFDGFEVDFDEAIARSNAYAEFERLF